MSPPFRISDNAFAAIPDFSVPPSDLIRQSQAARAPSSAPFVSRDEMLAALKVAQAILAMLVEPREIEGTSVSSAWAAAVAAEKAHGATIPATRSAAAHCSGVGEPFEVSGMVVPRRSAVSRRGFNRACWRGFACIRAAGSRSQEIVTAECEGPDQEAAA
ncbi:hypothetical protein J2X36_002167 [Methylobacterium sp. BE186]|uniref:hypothetical protein n=1 Tax=Methylobacterium sp. BE186 TaxID=2817715 RepID=UPI00285E7331|nr:hypothetical protein [Methylobacterium sp. BE186]MDR7037420.1 hypothetical protein [Methylobacterium sp. BE186]